MRTTKQHVRFALLLGAFSALGPLTVDMYLPSFPQITTAFGTKASLVQLSLTACLLGLAFGQIIMGALSDVLGRRKPIIASMLVYLLASFACALAPNIGFFIAARFIQGFAAASGIVISRAIVRDLFDGHELTRFFSLLMLVNNAAPLVAPVMGGGIISFTTWVGVFIALGTIGLVLTVLATWGLNESLPPERRTSSNLGQMLRNFGSLLADRQFTGYALAQGLMIGGVFAYVAGTPFIYQNIYGVSPQMFSILFGTNGISLILGSQIVGRYVHVVGERRFLLIGLFLAGFSSLGAFVWSLFTGPLPGLVILLFLFVASIGITGTSSFTLAMESQSHIAGSAAALLGVIPFILGSIVSPLVGIAGDSAVPMGLILFLTSFSALVAYFGLVRRKPTQVGAVVTPVTKTSGG
ncbi:multidrug effflux MFS transporter [Paenibacillus athensensis]|uniref:Bcr/CflA family efflux transporter n=1 Tax=Paenibacillus athensensis TaxID=1967502 RepID=A0A4Y8PTG5_9BACL|nr:multidrug effflux MFS transporter [Paenibacillus athensensis]MCD1257999.1 multidrug effflux MFS transporter [Paenibacillus athensensis]